MRAPAKTKAGKSDAAAGRVLVVGGAGYVGSHTCLALHEAGLVPVAYDNLSSGHAAFVRWGELERGDILDAARLDDVLARHRPVAIIHFAALSEVGRSVDEPLAFYRNNVAGTISLLEAAGRAGVGRIVFSSTCATYGEPLHLPMREDHRRAPVSPYGRSKAMVEEILVDAGAASGARSVALRYFNAAGADPEGRIGERHDPETHAVPLLIDAALGRRPAFRVFGTDYDTPDGTCVRDYVHVLDLGRAHVQAVRYLMDGGESAAFNLGTGTGTSVLELMRAVGRVSGRTVPSENAARRAGDPAILVADNARARERLGWQPTQAIDGIVESAWRWHSRRNA